MNCPKCKTKLKVCPGIGEYCPNKKCDVVDNIDGSPEYKIGFDEKYDDMYQDIANNIEIMNLMQKYQDGQMSRRRCISDIIIELKRMGYHKGK